MKYFLVLLLIIMAAVSTLFFNKDEQHNNSPVTGLPWQIDILPGGETRVFGITPDLPTGEIDKRWRL